MSFSTNPFSYIFRHENKYNIKGENVWQLEKHVRWFKTNLVLIFEKQQWEEINRRFENFRHIETNKLTGSYDTFLTLNLSRDRLSFVKPIDENIIQIPSSKHPIPKRYRPYSGGLNFGLIKNDRIVCFAAAPYILTKQGFSFAIIRNVVTKFIVRRQGFALKTVGVLCKELFSNYHISNIFLWVEERNTAARNLYKKLGFFEEAKVAMTYCDLKK
ncbi:MAG: GNAT family N-acetyltransferase [Candidatus Hodarchaeota archaeon]